ncbi:hypothetical protein B0H16DRAFT_1888685, partial [Mycena metata]
MHISSEEAPLVPQRPVDLRRKGAFSPYHRVLVSAFIIAITTSFSWTTIVYLYRSFTVRPTTRTQHTHHTPDRAMLCSQARYERHRLKRLAARDYDACALSSIEAVTAQDISLMGVVNTIAGTLNLLLTPWEIRHWGMRAALVQQSIWPTFRNVAQIYAVLFTKGRVGIAIVQASQAFGVLGGGPGFLLLLNSYIGEVVEPWSTPPHFYPGRDGYIVGRTIYELFGLVAPLTFSLLVTLTLFNALLLPYIPPAGSVPADTTSGATCFFALLATQYVPMMLQLSATNRYGYTPGDNGKMMSLNSISRALFLTFACPRIIKGGRVWFHARQRRRINGITETTGGSEDAAVLEKIAGSGFDLEFVRWSILVDAAITALVGLNSQSWHMLAAVTILPRASGTAPACKGVLTAMVPDARRADALAGIAIIETFALVLTVSLFGALFAFL